jgi:flavin reductase (DIM6/NTAB) family NADH-FMN oxidoreductase RutF
MKKPWNRVDLPVYSVSSKHGSEENMHICTYVSAVSMEPKRYMVALFKGTKTLELVSAEKRFVLQLLAEGDHGLIARLGRESGHQVDKLARLRKRQLVEVWKGFSVLSNAAAWIELLVIGEMDAGDHIMMLCDVMASKNVRDIEILTLDKLRARGLIRN